MDIIESEEAYHLYLNKGLKSIYYTNTSCGVCGSLKPQVDELFSSLEIDVKEVRISELKPLTAQQLIMQAPTLICYFDEKEIIRMSGFIDLNRLKAQLERMLL
jgi:hypothetical protein